MDVKSNSTDELAQLSALVGAPVAAAERSRWGFENQTDLVVLADGRRLVVQRIANRALAPHKLRLAAQLPERLASVGVRTPRQLAADAHANPPYAVREFLEGRPGPTLLASDELAVTLAREMGALLRQLAQVPTEGLSLNRAWADPLRLLRQAHLQLTRVAALLDAPTQAALKQTIDEAAPLLEGRTPCFAHGDFCPVNVLVDDVTTDDRRPTTNDRDKETRRQGDKEHSPTANRWQVVGLLDVEFARVADPHFDAAWWSFIVRYHHPARWQVAWPHLLEAAGIAATEVNLRRIVLIQRLRCLEALAYYAAFAPQAAQQWAGRMQQMVNWD